MQFTLNYTPDITKITQPYNTIIRAGYMDVAKDVSNNCIVVEDLKYTLTKIWFDCVKHPINKRELTISTIYFEHVNIKKDPNDTSTPNKFVYVKIPVIVDKKNIGTYTQLRRFITDINDGDMQTNPKINISINNTLFNADDSTAIPKKNLGKVATNTFTFSNSISSTLSTVSNVGYIVELAPMNVAEACKFSVNDDAFDISVFTNTNVTTKSTPNNPNNNNTITSHKDTVNKEGFMGLNERIESFVEGLTCKRKANTGIINGTVMSRDFADKLIESQTQIGIATVVMFFVSLFVITMVYLTAKSYDEYDVVIGNATVAPKGGGAPRVGRQKGGGELCDINEHNLFTGYLTVLGISCFMLNMYGAIKLKEMYMLIGAIFFAVATGTYYFIYANNFSIFDIELEHLILYNRNKPFVKWVAISGYYLFFALFIALITNPKLTVNGFYTTQAAFIAFCVGAYLLWHNDIMVQKVITKSPDAIEKGFTILDQLTNGIFNFPFILLFFSSLISSITLS